MYKIRPWLYTGSYIEKLEANKLEEVGIGAMLQLFRPSELPNVVSLYLPVEDGYPIRDATFDKARNFIRAHRQDRLLIACGAGVSRSTTFAIVALKEAEGLKITEALAAVREIHPEAIPDQVHWESLRRYYGEGADFWEVWKEAQF